MALIHLHGKKIAHRDVKSSNVLLDKVGNAKLSDCGLIHVTSSIDRMHSMPISSGGLAYLPYETRSGQIGTFTDIFALSIVLWEVSQVQVFCLLKPTWNYPKFNRADDIIAKPRQHDCEHVAIGCQVDAVKTGHLAVLMKLGDVRNNSSQITMYVIDLVTVSCCCSCTSKLHFLSWTSCSIQSI